MSCSTSTVCSDGPGETETTPAVALRPFVFFALAAVIAARAPPTALAEAVLVLIAAVLALMSGAMMTPWLNFVKLIFCPHRADTHCVAKASGKFGHGVADILTQGLTSVPPELRGDIVSWLPLQGFVSVSACSKSGRRLLWSAPEVWRAIASSRGFVLPTEVNSCAQEVRTAFRWALYRLDGQLLRSLPRNNHSAILREAARMASGLLPGDGKEVMDDLCKCAESALDAHDPGCAVASEAAEHFLQVAQDSAILLGELRLEQLEHAHGYARQLHMMMVSAMQEHLDRSIQEIQDSFWTQSIPNSDDSSSESEEICEPSH